MTLSLKCVGRTAIRVVTCVVSVLFASELAAAAQPSGSLNYDEPLVGENIPSDHETVSIHDLQSAGIDWFGPDATLPVRCPYQGEGHTLHFSQELYEGYRKRGFSLRALCLALGSGDVHYDPLTGRKLRGYILAEEEEGAEEVHPFTVPDCFRKVSVIHGAGTAEQVWRPTGCEVRFDPRKRTACCQYQ